MKKVILFCVGFLLGVILFIPKEELYYTFQSFLKDKQIFINSSVKSNIKLSLDNGTLFYRGADVLKFKKVDIYPFLVFNQIDGENIVFNVGNYKITSLKIIYTLFYPIKVFISAKSNFGDISGEIDLIKRDIKLYILNLKNNSLKSILKKDEKGYFYYAKF
jgi:hypothetical protein